MNNTLFSIYTRPISPIPTDLKPQGKLDGPIRCVLFDVYGTLFISGSGDIGVAKKEFAQNEKLKQLMLKYRIDKPVPDVLHEFFRAIENKHAQLRNEGIDTPEVEIDQIWKEVLKLDNFREFALEFELIVNPVFPMPHLKEMLIGCQRRHLLTGIISNAQFFTKLLFSWFLEAELEDLGFSSELVIFSYRFGRAKPSLSLFNHAAERLREKNITENSVLYVGNDMLNDIYPAKMVGFKTALFAGDKRSLRIRENDPRCRQIRPDIVITDLIQLLDHLPG
ncbi:HAD family hydrolase [Thermodesulfobacteriota bacterium]